MLVSVLAAAPAAAGPAEPACAAGKDVALFVFPETPIAGTPAWVVAVSEAPIVGDLVLLGGDVAPRGEAAALPVVRRGGPPHSLVAALARAPAGAWRAELRARGGALAYRRVAALRRPAAPARRDSAPAPAWRAERAWDAAAENLYAAWVEALFAAPADDALVFPSLAMALRDPRRNFLWNARGLGEDGPGRGALPARPDCADLPYFLRAYFAWKLRLPFAFRDCDRGTAARPPRCRDPQSQLAPVRAPDDLAAMKRFLRLVANTVHSGSARTGLSDADADFEPVALAREALRPGAVYADPYGHVLVLAAWAPARGDRGGRLLAIDGQPDGTVARKRFWEGTFLFASDVASAGAGWKRPRALLVDDGAGARATAAGPGGPSLEQQDLAADDFYARMAHLIDPEGLDPEAAYEETLAALREQLEARVLSVQNGEDFARAHPGVVIAMPDGAAIFETTGPWEDFATPSRDLRLLVALRVLSDFPARVFRRPALYRLASAAPAAARERVAALHRRRAGEVAFVYKNSAGADVRLTVADVLARRAALEMAYNPNDCVELRWGAPEGSPELTTCRRRAPDEQRARMQAVRAWFRDARRPPR